MTNERRVLVHPDKASLGASVAARFITKLLDFCKANAGSIGFISYFNIDPVSSGSLPGHLMKPWSGISTASTSCMRSPPGDNNRCSARAFASWAAANS